MNFKQGIDKDGFASLSKGQFFAISSPDSLWTMAWEGQLLLIVQSLRSTEKLIRVARHRQTTRASTACLFKRFKKGYQPLLSLLLLALALLDRRYEAD